MGCDGGTIPKRDELVRTKKKKEAKDKTSELNFRWRCCSITQTPLEKPIVACGLGKLYNKDSVIGGLLDRTTLPESAKHLKNLKDVRELNLTVNPAFAAKDETGDGYVDHQCSPFICPIIGLEMNGKFKFCFYWSCGCVVSERSVKQLKADVCHKCQKAVAESDLVILNAVEDELDLMRTRLEARQARIKAQKKAKKSPPSTSVSEKVETKPAEKSDSKAAKPAVAASKRNGPLSMQAPELKKAKTDYSVAKDPEASDVFKSIFTSSKDAKSQNRAHWITYNPFYN